MKEVRMTQKLKSFLIREKLLTKFKNNADEDLTKAKFVFRDIHGAFLWDNSPEGQEFWNKIDEKFNHYEM